MRTCYSRCSGSIALPAGGGKSAAQEADRRARQVFTELLDTCEREQILDLRAIHAYWPAQAGR